MTQLHKAAKQGNLEETINLLNNRCDVNALDEHGYTPLHLAVYYAHTEVVDYLIERNDVNINAQANCSIPLPWSVSSILHKIPQDNTEIKDGATALHIAAEKGDTEIAELLLDREANVNAEAKDGDTPLHLAVYQNHKGVVELLLENKANVNAIGKESYTPLHLVAFLVNEEIANILIEKGANIDAQDDRGYTPLHLAIRLGHSRLVNLLLDKGAEVNAKTKDGRTPLQSAKSSKNEKLIELLLEKGAKDTAEDSNLELHPKQVKNNSGNIHSLEHNNWITIAGAFIGAIAGIALGCTLLGISTATLPYICLLAVAGMLVGGTTGALVELAANAWQARSSGEIGKQPTPAQ